MIPRNPLQELRNLDRTSARFHDKLSNFIRGDAYRNALPGLQSENLTWLIEYLDSILFDISDHRNPVFQEFLHELKKICGIKEVLPKSCTLSESLLGCAYEGTFNGSKVRIRRVWVCPGRETQKIKEIFHQVVVTSKHLEHQNIVPLLGVTMEPLELISDWMPGGDLLGYIAEHPDACRPSLLSDVAEGLHYLHSYDVIHGDLKSSNVLVDATGHARLTDFGLALVAQYPGSMLSTFFEHDESARWIAPEILDDRATYSKEADVFSFAGVAIEVFAGVAPFHDRPPHAARSAVMGGERPPRPTHPTLTDGVWTLIRRCWNENPHLRPHALRISCTFGDPAWKRLMNSPLPLDGQISLITEILSDRDETEVVKGLSGDEAQSFVDVVDKVLDSIGPPLRQKCLSVLCKLCGRQALLPRSLRIPLCYDRSNDPLYTGGFADVWMGEHQGTKVAVKVLRVSESSNLTKITSRFCKEVITWRSLRHPNVLPLLGVTMSNKRFAMISEWMDNGNINEFIEEHRDVNRFELLKDVTRGLIYMHDQAMVHGDLKGANILIDEDCHARLADFGLLTFVSDPAIPSASISTTNLGGTTRWMSPELFHPELFGFADSRLTKQSDCYALGMVILEVLTGQAPFACYEGYVVMRKVVDGERPERPKEAWFTDDLWGTLEQCWSSRSKGRPTIEAVLECLERVSLATPLFSAGLKKRGNIAVASGGFTDIWRGDLGERRVAIKVFREYPAQNLKEAKKILWERVPVWMSLSHPNILQFRGVNTTLFQLSLVYNLGVNGNIMQYTTSHPRASRPSLLFGVAKGLEYLHSLEITHGDIKGANVVIDRLGHARLTEYGLAPIYSDPSFAAAATPGSVGTSRWLAPEIITPARKRGTTPVVESKAADVFAFGMLAVEVFTGKVPFEDQENEVAVLRILKGGRPEMPGNADAIGLTVEMWNLIESCWRQNPKKRPTMQEVARKWLKFVDNDDDDLTVFPWVFRCVVELGKGTSRPRARTMPPQPRLRTAAPRSRTMSAPIGPRTKPEAHRLRTSSAAVNTRGRFRATPQNPNPDAFQQTSRAEVPQPHSRLEGFRHEPHAPDQGPRERVPRTLIRKFLRLSTK